MSGVIWAKLLLTGLLLILSPRACYIDLKVRNHIWLPEPGEDTTNCLIRHGKVCLRKRHWPQVLHR